MLFEEAMMYHLFGVERDLAFVSASVGFEGPDAEAALQKPHLNHPHTHTSRMVEPMPFYR